MRKKVPIRFRMTPSLGWILALAMLFAINAADAADLVITNTVEDRQVLADGDTLTVKGGGRVDVTAEDADVTAVGGDAADPEIGFTNGRVTVENGGAIMGKGKATSGYPNDINTRAILTDAAGDSTFGLTNAGIIAATAEAVDHDAQARAIQVFNPTFDTNTGAVLVENLPSGTISAFANSTLEGEASARGIHAGKDIIGTITNYGNISASAQGGDATKAFGIQFEEGLTLLNYGAIEANVKVFTQADSVYNSRAIGVFADNLSDPDDDVAIFNQAGARITASAHFQVGEHIDDNPGAIGIKVADGWYLSGAGVGPPVLSRRVVNDGTISATSTLHAVDEVYENPGAGGIRAGHTGTANSVADQVRTSRLEITNNGVLNAETEIASADEIDDNPGAFGIRTGRTEAYQSGSGGAGAVASTAIVNSGAMSARAGLTAPNIHENSGAYGIQTGRTYAADSDDDASSTATATTTIANSGTIEAAAVFKADEHLNENLGAFGIRTGETYTAGGYESTATTTIVNSGRIASSATLTAPEVEENSGAFGIRSGNDRNYADDGRYHVTVTNRGSIRVDATIETDDSDDNSGAFGIRTGTAKVINTGTIDASATINGLDDSAYDGAYGIRTGDGAATVIHSGAITAGLIDHDTSTKQRAVGIMTGRDYNQIHLSGDVTATASGGEAYAIVMGCQNQGDANALMVMNGARLVGDVLNAGPTGSTNGAATAVFGLQKTPEAMADFGPHADFSEFSAALKANPQGGLAGVPVDDTFSFTFNDDFLGEAGWNLLLMGGTTTLYNSAASAIHEMRVAPRATLAGNVYVAGNFTQMTGSTYLARVGDNGKTDHPNDALHITGKANIAPGGKLKVTTDGYVADGDIYTVLSAGTLEGFYAAEDLIENSTVLDYTLIDDNDNTVKLAASRIPYRALGIGGNAGSVGSALLDLAALRNPDALRYLAFIDNSTTIAELDTILSSMAPDEYPSLIDASMAGARLYRSSVVGRMGNLHRNSANRTTRYASNTVTSDGPVLSRLSGTERPSGGGSVWARTIGLTAEQDPDKSLSGFKMDTIGISLGYDRKLNEALSMGVGFGLNNSDMDSDDGSQTEIDGHNIGLYATFSTPAFYVDGGIFYAGADYESRIRRLLTGLARSTTNGSQWGAYLGAGYTLVETRRLYVIPTASLEWARIDIDGFTEIAATLPYQVSDYDAESFVSTLGLRLGSELIKGVNTELRLGWAHEFGDTDRVMKARFVGGGTATYAFTGVEPEKDSARVGLGLNTDFGHNFNLSIDYDGEFRSDFDGHSVSAMLRYNF